MIFLADENIDRPIIEALRNEGFTVLSIDETYPGVADGEVLRGNFTVVTPGSVRIRRKNR